MSFERTQVRDTSPRWGDVTALFGGRFDPPHLGHREAVRGLFNYPGVKRVIVLPSATPPHKRAIASAEQRAEMSKLNFQSTPSEAFPPECEVSLFELEKSLKDPTQASYTYDTLTELKQKLGPIAFVIGTDQLEQFSTWHRFPEILSLSHWIILERKGAHQDAIHKTLKEWESSGLICPSQPSHSSHNDLLWRVARHARCQATYLTIVPTEAPNLSSTMIREALVRTGKPPTDSLTPQVLAYLKQKHLYGMED